MKMKCINGDAEIGDIVEINSYVNSAGEHHEFPNGGGGYLFEIVGFSEYQGRPKFEYKHVNGHHPRQAEIINYDWVEHAHKTTRNIRKKPRP
jgi:hypothetical protein